MPTMNEINFATDLDACIFVAGHKGMVGSAIVRQLQDKGYTNIVCADRKTLDLCKQTQVDAFFEQTKPDYVFLSAAKVGGIHSNNTYPADFIYENLMIECNVINASKEHQIKRLLALGSTCIYPKLAPQPIKEDSLLDGHLEPTNEPYAVAKIAGIKLCESYNRQFDCDFRSVMPTNLYGPGDNFHPENSHVIPAMLLRFHLAKLNKKPFVEIWGSGKPKREFLHVDDMAAGSIHIMSLTKARYESLTSPMCSHINIGTGEDISIKELAETIKNVVGFEGELQFNTDKPDGAPRKLCSADLANQAGWHFEISLHEGLEQTYQWYVDNIEGVREA